MSPLLLTYLVSHYPAISHTFIEREVRALRELGVDIETWSVHPTPPGDIMSVRDAEAVRTTRTILGRGLLAVLRAHLLVLVTAPVAYLSTIRNEVRGGRPGLRGRVWAAFYFAEAVILHADLRRSGRRHVHVHLTNNASDVARAAVRLGRARGEADWSWSLTVHGPTEFADVVGTDLAAKVQDALFVVCISDFARSQLMALVPEDHWSKLVIVHCGVEPDRFPLMSDRRAGRTGPLRILNVGRLVGVKGQAVLLQALAEHVRAGGDAEVALVGRGPTEQSLRALADHLGVADRVQFLSAVGQDHILEWYAWADVFCLPSFAEGVPVVLMEAMATGLPVVTTAIAGIPELVEDRRSGYLVPPGRPDALVRAWERCSDPALRRELGAAGRAAILASFEVNSNAHLLRDHFARALTPPGAAEWRSPRARSPLMRQSRGRRP
jgi:glycosyltransferase involved in cell wall biosynthesis